MDAENRLKFPGLRWRKRKGSRVPYWFAPIDDVKAGYPVKSVNLSEFTTDPTMLSARCLRLFAEVRMWRRDGTVSAAATPSYDGTFGPLIDIWLNDPDSPFHGVKQGTRKPYLIYARKLKRHIGEVCVADTDGRQVKRWFGLWASQDPQNPKRFKHLAAGRMALTVLKAAVSFGIVCRNADCVSFKTILSELEFKGNKPRTVALTAEQVAAACVAAHAAGSPSRALCYAAQFETTLRQWDLIGVWVPLSDPRPSTVIDGSEKWVGPHWHQIDSHMILRTIHGKTEELTEARGVYDLSICPMVMAEIDRILPERRAGPLIVNEKTGLPYRYDDFKDNGWKPDFKAAGLPASVWNRDFRASGNTEASKGQAHKEDRAKVSGNSQKINAQVYDRDALEAHRRVMQARMTARNGSKT